VNDEQNTPEKEPRTPRGNRERPRRSFNFYWIYGVIILVILSINLFTLGGDMAEIEPGDIRSFVEAGDVDRVVFESNESKKIAKVYLKKDALAKEPHKSRIHGSMLTGPNVAGPHYFMNIGVGDAYQQDLHAIRSRRWTPGAAN